MRAAQISQYGPPDAVTINDVAAPEPGAGEVLVRVEASSVNGHDTAVRSGALRIMTGHRFPIGIGLDFAGTVAATGTGDTGWAVGDRVWGTVAPRGRHVTAAAAEFVVVPGGRLGLSPATLSAVEAAALVVTGTTALTALRDSAALRPGESVLVRGAAGGVGAAAVQLARALGGRVTALARGRDAALVTALGADQVLDYRHTTPQQCGPFDVIVDTAGSDLARYRRRLRPGGRMVTVAFGSGAAMAAIAASTVFGSRRIRTFSADPHSADLDDLARHVANGDLHAGVDRVHPLDDVPAAHLAFGEGGHPGKQVITLV